MALTWVWGCCICSRGDGERRVFVASIGPVWDGNEVWLVTFGGALFAAFPEAYATIFSGFYIVFMLVLLALISRAVSLDFRSKIKSPSWRKTCDVVFCISSASATLLFGVGVGNAMIGVPLDSRYLRGGVLQFARSLCDYRGFTGGRDVRDARGHLLAPEDDGRTVRSDLSLDLRTYGVFVLMYLVVTIATWLNVPRAMAPFQSNPLAWLVVVVNLAAVIGIPCALYLHRSGWAFMASCLSICAFILLLGLTLFPNLVTSQPNLENSLTIYNAASSQKTLSIMLLIAVIGMPFVLTYTAIIYWVFRGRVAAWRQKLLSDILPCVLHAAERGSLPRSGHLLATLGILPRARAPGELVQGGRKRCDKFASDARLPLDCQTSPATARVPGTLTHDRPARDPQHGHRDQSRSRRCIAWRHVARHTKVVDESLCFAVEHQNRLVHGRLLCREFEPTSPAWKACTRIGQSVLFLRLPNEVVAETFRYGWM